MSLPPTPRPDPLEALRASLAHRLLQHTPSKGLHAPAALPGLMLIREDRPYVNVCASYEPCVALIVQGRKRLSLGAEVLTYGPERYLIASMDLPVTAALLDASPETPYLAVGLRLNWRDLAALLLEMPTPPTPEPASHHRALATGALTPELLGAFDRLLALLDHPADLPALAPLITREIHYRLLTGEVGTRLRQMATVGSQSQQIARAIASLNARFDQALRVDDLAREAGMSGTTFHQHFKALTAMSPLQYQKSLRLAEARRLMLSDGLEASTAAFRVGYESPSQFSREYARHFGAPPSRDMAALRQRASLSASAAS